LGLKEKKRKSLLFWEGSETPSQPSKPRASWWEKGIGRDTVGEEQRIESSNGDPASRLEKNCQHIKRKSTQKKKE